MPKYRIQAPDGNTYEIVGPEGATREQVIARVQQQLEERRGGEAMAQGMKENAVNAATVPLIAAGRRADKIIEGTKEAALGANVAAREAMGMPNGDQLRQMAQMDEMQKGNDAAYAPLQEKHPFLTGVGESLPLLAVPGGQATAMGRIAAPMVAAGAMGAASYGPPEQRLKTGAGDMALAGLGGSVGEIARSVVAPAKSSLTAAQQKALERAASTIGYKPRASEMTGSETLRRVEDAVARQPGGAGPMRDLMDQNDRAVARHLSKGIGENSDALTEDVLANASKNIGKTYDEMRGRAKMPVDDPVFNAVSSAQTILSRGDSTGPKKEAFDTLERLKDALYKSKEFDGAEYQSWAVDLGAKARELGKTNRTAASALRDVEKAMDAQARGSDAALWQQTDKQHGALEMLMRPGVVNTQTGKASPVKLAGQMEREFGKAMKTGKITGPNADVAALGRAFPPMAEGSQTAGREAFGGLPGWLMAGPTYGIAKALSSEAGREYLAKGLLGHPGVSRGVAGLLQRGALPLSIAEIEAQLLGYQ